MPGLVLEGGSLRAIFSAGAMDALLDHQIYFNYVIGVSGGITNGGSYISKQKGRNLEVLQKYRSDKRYISKRNMIRYGAIFGIDFLFDEIPNKLIPMDWEAYYNFPGTIKIGITDAQTGKALYKDGKQMDKKCTLLRATCAIPFLLPPVNIDGRLAFDGGLSDSIPIKQSIADGNQKNLVILTQPENFKKQSSKIIKLASIAYKKKYPNIVKSLEERPKMYNDTIDYIKQLEAGSPEQIVVLRPKYKLSSFESNIKNIEKAYQHGYEVALEQMEAIRKLFL